MTLLKLMDNHLLAVLRATNFIDVRRAQLWMAQHFHASLLIQVRSVQAHDDVDELVLQTYGSSPVFCGERRARVRRTDGDARGILARRRRVCEHLYVKSRETVVLHHLQTQMFVRQV